MDTKQESTKQQLIRDCYRLLFVFAILLVLIPVFSYRRVKPIVVMKNADTVAVYTKNTVRSTHGILSALEPGESVQVWYQMNGCFGSEGYKLEIIRKKNVFVAELFQWDQTLMESLLNIYWADYFIRSARMDTAALAAFREFERVWPQIGPGGCTSISSYRIRSKYINTELTDFSCQNDHFNILLKKIFHN